MMTTTFILFYAATAAYVAGAVAVLVYLTRGGRPLLKAAGLCGGLGAAGYLAALVLRGVHWGQFPLTTMTDGLSLFAVSATVLMLAFTWRDRVPELLCFLIPPLAIICLMMSMAAPRALATPPEPLLTLPLALHAGSAFLAYTLFFLASMASAAYLFQAQRLKAHKTHGLFRRLPSLEQLDRSLYRLTAWGCVLFVLSLALGLLWAWLDSHLLGPHWWLSPKVGLAVAAAVFFIGVYWRRRFRGLRGPRLAYLILGGFSSIFLLYIVLALAEWRTLNFWGAAG